MDAWTLQDSWTELDGVRMHAATVGTGPPIVLVHGYGVSGRYMLPLARALAPRFSVYVPDLPGHGLSQRSRLPSGIGSHAETLGGWLTETGLGQPPIVANSMGCQVVTKLAEQSPQLVGPMVLIGPTVDPERRRARHQLFGALRDSHREPVRLFARAALDCAGQSLPSLLSAARSALADRIEDRLASIEQETVVILGEQDGFVSRSWAEQVTALLPRGRLVVLPGEPHAVHYTQPSLVSAIISDHIAEDLLRTHRELRQAPSTAGRIAAPDFRLGHAHPPSIPQPG